MLALLALASFEAVTPLAAAARDLSATLAAGRRVLELTDRDARPSAIRRDPAPAPVWPFAVALEDVRARYPGEQRPALDGVSLRLEPGERVALLGPSGAGKTTVANLLLRFLDPERRAGHRSPDAIFATTVRTTSGTRSRSPARSRICSRRRSATTSASRVPTRATTSSRMRSAARGSGTGSARLPDGLDTFVGEEGRELSGGQRQRIVLARALLAGAPVLVLDEPTAHLDPQTASELIDDVFAAAGDRTVLLITHRTEGLDLVDRVVTL